MSKLIALILSFILGFGFGMGSADDKATDSELKQKVRDHMDIIVDESAGIVDDVIEEIREDERVQNAEKFINDVNEIADNTARDIQDHFGKEEKTEEETAEAESDETNAENAEDAAEEEAEGSTEEVKAEETVPEESA